MQTNEASPAQVELKSDEGLVRSFVGKIQALGVKALANESVEEPVRAAVSEAMKQFGAWVPTSSEGNRRAYIGQLKMMAAAWTSTQEAYRETLLLAARMAEEHGPFSR